VFECLVVVFNLEGGIRWGVGLVTEILVPFFFLSLSLCVLFGFWGWPSPLPPTTTALSVRWMDGWVLRSGGGRSLVWPANTARLIHTFVTSFFFFFGLLTSSSLLLVSTGAQHRQSMGTFFSLSLSGLLWESVMGRPGG
jgi:hypothetical protein